MTLTANSSHVSYAAPGPTPDGDATGSNGPPVLAAKVTAVLVAHDGATWLPRALAAVAAQTWQPDRILAVDTGSRDETPGLLRRALGADQVWTVSRTTGFGDAVRAALANSAAVPSEGRVEWLWLLHDDCAPEPDALARLLAATRRSPSIGVAGPKLVSWDDRENLLEVGLTTSRGGRRLTDVEPGERDQGQLDHRHDVLAVGTAGLLVRRDVWDRLGGLDPALPLFRDDIDFGWRAQLAGHRVIVVPNARVADARASTRGLRPVDAVHGATRRVDRTHGLQVAMTGASVLALPFLLVWFAAGSVLRGLGLLVAKQPRRAYDELVSVWAAVLTPWRVVASRWRARGTREVPRRDIARLLAPRRSAFHGFAESFSGSMGRDKVEVLDAPTPETGPAGEEAENVERVTTRLTRRILTNPGVLVVALSAAVTDLLSRPLVGRGTLAGGQLLSWNGTAAEAWHSYVDAWHGGGLGSAAPPAPYRAVLAGLAWLLQPLTSHPTALAVDVVLIGAIPVSALTAYVAARTVLPNRWVRGWAALTWATLPTVTGALAVGRVGPSVVHMLLPLVVLGFARTLRRPGSSTAAFAGGLALAVAGSFVPVLLLVGSAAALVALVLGGWARRARALLLLAVPAVLLAPWLSTLWDEPRLFLTGPGLLARAGGASTPFEVALLHPGGPGGTYVLLSAPVLLAGLAGIFRRGGSWLLASCAMLAVTGLALALALPRLVVASGTPATASAGLTGSLAGWSGTGIDLLALAALVAALHGVDGIGARLSRHKFGWRQLILAPLAAAAVITTLVTLVLIGLHPSDGPVHRDAAALLPAVAVDQATGPMATRTLVLTAGRPATTPRPSGSTPGSADAIGSGGVGYRLVGSELGDPALTVPLPDAEPLVAAVTQTLVAPASDVGANAAAQALLHLGIGFVVATRPVPGAFAEQLDTTAGLTRLGESGSFALWRVEATTPTPGSAGSAGSAGAAQPPARVRLVDAAGRLVQDVPVSGPSARVDTTIPAGAVGRRLILAEPVSPVWRASLGGVRLQPLVSGGLQAFELPPTGGRLTVSSTDNRHRLLQVQGAAVVVVALLALPLGRRRRTDEVTG
jgi:GT2 family glycosyltransferase